MTNKLIFKCKHSGAPPFNIRPMLAPLLIRRTRPFHRGAMSVSPSSPKIHWVSSFPWTSPTSSHVIPLPLYLLYHSFILYLASSDESFYPLIEFTHSHSLTSPCTFAFSGLCKPSRPYSHPHFSFSALQFPPPLLYPRIYFPVAAISVHLHPSSSFFPISPLIGRQMLTLAY